MAIKVGEKPRARKATIQFPNPEASREFWVSGATDEVSAINAVVTSSRCPQSISLPDTTGKPNDVYIAKLDGAEQGGGCWDVVVRYGNTPDTTDLRFNIGTQTVKTQQALEHIRTYDCINGGFKDGPGNFGKIPDFKKAICISADGRTVEGADTDFGTLEFTITKKYRFAALPANYTVTLANMSPSVNDDVWTFGFQGQVFVFSRGCVKFKGAFLSGNSELNAEFTYNFAYSKGLGKPAPAWVDGITYNFGILVSRNGYLFQSIANGNTTQPQDFWDVFRVYATGAKVIFGDSLSARIYESTIDDNLSNQPDVSPDGEWTDIGESEWVEPPTPDSTALSIGASGPIVKEGWHFIWPWYRPGVVNGCNIPVPAAVSIDRTLEYASFDNIQL